MAVTETTLGALMAQADLEPDTEVMDQPTDTVDTPAAEPAAAEPNVEQPATPAQSAPAETNFVDFDLPDDDTPAQAEGAAPQQPQDWKTILKGVDKKELYKELDLPELDEFDKEFINFRKNGGDPLKYLEAKAIDYTKISDDDLVKTELKRQFPDATSAQLERLFNKKYNQSETAEDDEKDDGLLMMKSDARRLRQQLIEDQKKFSIPAYAQPEQAEAMRQIAEQQAAQQQQAAALNEYVSKHEATQKLLADKQVTMDLGDGVSFNYKLKNPEKIVSMVLNPEQSRKLTVTPDGKLDLQKLYITSLFLSNPQKFAKDLVNFGKTLKLNEQIEEGQNAGLPSAKASVQSQVSEKEAWKNPQTTTLGQMLGN
jgi:hypothetical protein